MKTVVSLVVVVFLVACSGTDDQALEQGVQPGDPDTAYALSLGTVEITIDGRETAGSGIAFVTGDELWARLLVGPPGEYLQFDLIGDAAASPFTIEPGVATPTTIIGGDAAANKYTVIDGSAANTYSLERSGEGSVVGAFDISANHADGTTSQMSGVFHVAASEGGDWDCDWDGDLVTNCRFTN